MTTMTEQVEILSKDTESIKKNQTEIKSSKIQ